MVSSLAAQLSKGTSLNASILTDRSRRKRAESYLFTSREADQHDFYSIYALGVTGLSKLKTLNIKFAEYEDNLFSDASRELDRTLQSVSENAKLDRTLGALLRDLGPYLLEAPASKVLEWLVRRFRVNEFNLDDVMALFLPYHDTPHFAKMASLMHVGKSRTWSFLGPTKAAGKPLPKSILVDEMLKNVDLARFVVELLPHSLETGRVHRTLVGFTAGVMIDYLKRMKRVSEETIAFVLPSVMRLFAADSDTDSALAGYIILATLSQQCRLSSQTLIALVAQMIKGQRHIESQQFFPLLIAVLDPQDILDEFTDPVVSSMLELSGIIDALPLSLQWPGVEKLIIPLLPFLVHHASEKLCFGLLESILCSSETSKSIIERHTVLCMESILHSADTPDPALLRLLAVTSQRYGTVFSRAYSERLKAEEDNENRVALESIIRSLTVPTFSTIDDSGKWILSSRDFNFENRVMSVRELLKALDAGDTGEDLYEALRSRVMDSKAAVIETLYSQPQTVTPILNNLPFIESVSMALETPGLSRTIMRLHFTFIADNVFGHNPELTPAIFRCIYLPYILFTKPRQKTAALVWQTMRHSKLSEHELLAGCMDIVFPQSEAPEDIRSLEEMETINMAVTAKIAGNIVASNTYPRHFDMLLDLLAAKNSHTTLLVYLIFRSLLDQLSGEHRVDAAHRILTAIGLQSLDALHDVVKGTERVQNAISDKSLSKSVVLKPSSAATLHRLQAAVLALMPIVERPVMVKIDWLDSGISGSFDVRGIHFAKLARAVYDLANSSSAAQRLSTSILRALFLNLRDETLLFLAGIWTTDLQSNAVPTNLRVAALFHGLAFLKARSADAEHPQDFQVILPSLLIALHSEERSVREAALDCIGVVEQTLTSSAIPTIYAWDSVYGINSRGLQYLEQSDFGRYVSSLHSRREHFINDRHYLGVFQQEMLCRKPGEGKKEAGYKHRILCYMLSHVAAWPSLEARVVLLGTLENVSSPAKLQMLLPLIQQLIPGKLINPQQDERCGSVWNTYCQSLLQAFDSTAATDLNETGSASWAILIRLLCCMFVDDAPQSVCEMLLRQLCSGLFFKLTEEHQLEICTVLVDAAAAHLDHHAMIKETLSVLLRGTTLINSLLTHFQPSGADSSQRAAKRTKTIESLTEQSLRPLTVLVETLITTTLPCSVELMSCTIEVLTRIFHTHSSSSDANYLMQLLMSMLESLASSLTVNSQCSTSNAHLPSATQGTTNLSPRSVRMEILVELLRVSDNPQTFNQALLVIASLARLAPESVMQNVMPVFTFMGSNVFHRDDSYSFRVVQKTVESIVPVMIRSLKVNHSGPVELQTASKEFLRIFTDASTHVPRHRRTQFFNHLVKVLGPEEFTVPICLLLVDKASNRVVRQKPGDVANALSLPLAILQTNFKTIPFKIIEKLLKESSLLLTRANEPELAVTGAFLEFDMDVEQKSLATTKRRIQAILTFVDDILQHFSRRGSDVVDDAVRESVRTLLELADVDHRSILSKELADIPQIALKTFEHLLRTISVMEFTSSIAMIVATKNSVIGSGAMNLLSSRITYIAPNMRQEISPTIISIIEHICESLGDCQDLPTLRADLKALAAIAKSSIDNERTILTKAVPGVLQVGVRQESLTSEVLQCILPLSGAIGPRILPFFRSVIELCCEALMGISTMAKGQDSNIAEQSQSVLVALLSSLSQFWGIDELARVTALSLAKHQFSIIRKTLAKRVPTNQLLPALFRVWPDVVAAAEPERSLRRETFFDLVKWTVRSSPREDIHEHLRQTFKLFLEAFDIVGVTMDAESSRNQVLAAFVEFITKLNEAAFKPLYRRLFDWAFDESIGPETSSCRQVTFCCVLTALIRLLKGLITPYMSIALGPLTEKLNLFLDNQRQLPSKLWLSAIELFKASVDHDEGAFWRTDKLQKLVLTLIAQMDVCPSLGVSNARQAFKTCLSALAVTIDDDSLLKMLNLEVLMKTRSDDAQVRLFALQCAVYMWRESGDKLTGFVSDVVTFIAECADDEHDEVAKEARKLKKTVESRCGSLDLLMQ